MKFNFKPLSSFFKSTTTEEEKDKKEEKKAGDDQNKAGDDQDSKEDDQGSEDDEKNDDEDETGEKSAKSDKKSDKNSTISITQAEYKDFVAAKSELQKFGKTSEDRANFLKDAAQLSTWYEAAKSVGATSKTDANATEKSKKVSKITSEAKAAFDKAASQKPKA